MEKKTTYEIAFPPGGGPSLREAGLPSGRRACPPIGGLRAKGDTGLHQDF
ncbi:hypothetical protein KUV23_03575 [Algoriphagus marincola]|uniref:Uncharacterized protein n=1 Tax=Algoriphagus marincola TaxID=264027 RepID=A0ABS7N145_9BACT|nr:hypothetical protein [Algoriphagus marincola]MBY5950038.1 hypothetical protein [Algoriphagus marincola]